MKRLAFVIAACCAGAVPALAATGTKVINNSGLPIDELSIAAPGTTKWSPNLMKDIPEGALDSGKQVVIAGLKDGTFDLRISAPDEGVFCTMKHVAIKKRAVELTPEMGKTCK